MPNGLPGRSGRVDQLQLGHPLTRRALLVGAGAALGVLASRRTGAMSSEPFTLGLTPVLMISDLELLEALQTYFEAALGLPVQFVTRRTYQEITLLVVSGQVDAAWICGYPYVQYREELSLVAVPIWQGQPLYRSYLIVDRDRQATEWQSLAGDIHAFSDPDSNSGYLVTAALLAEHGRRPESFFRSSFFTYGHRNVVRAVASGLAHSGSVDGYVWDVMRKVEPELAERTRVLRKSPFHGFPPIVCARESADLVRTHAAQQALLSMKDNRIGRQALQLLQLDGFAPAAPELFASIAANVALIGRQG